MIETDKTTTKQTGQEEGLGDDGLVYDTDCGDGFTGVYLPLNTSSFLYVNFCMSIKPQKVVKK